MATLLSVVAAESTGQQPLNFNYDGTSDSEDSMWDALISAFDSSSSGRNSGSQMRSPSPSQVRALRWAPGIKRDSRLHDVAYV